MLTADPGEPLTPSALHPVFCGSFDWHSCVHGYWLLATVLRLDPGGAEAEQIRALFDRRLTPRAVAAEQAYLERPETRGFERPYGWAWLLMLDAELHRHTGQQAASWQAAIWPLAALLAGRLAGYVGRSPYPVRHGMHANTAFALALACEYAAQHGDAALAGKLAGAARRWYGADRDCQAWEPGGDEFLSPALVEAEAMRRLLPAGEFAPWLAAFLPGLGERRPASLFIPAQVADRSDGKMVHLDGLNLSRAWCFLSLAGALPGIAPVLREAAGLHLAASLPHVAGDYMGEHWLASFALLALLEPQRAGK